jgi:hypothetical protein
MRALIQTTRKVGSTSRLAVSITALIAVAVGVSAYFADVSRAVAGEGEPVITSLVLADNEDGTWQVSGTISCSEGYSGMQLHFDGSLIDEHADVASNGSFNETYSMNPGPFDWLDAQATDRWEQESEVVTHYF